MNREDKRLVAALTMLADQLGPIVDEILAGVFNRDERRAFAVVLCTIAGSLDPGVVLADPAGPRDEQQRPAGSPPAIWPGWPGSRFSTSGP